MPKRTSTRASGWSPIRETAGVSTGSPVSEQLVRGPERVSNVYVDEVSGNAALIYTVGYIDVHTAYAAYQRSLSADVWPDHNDPSIFIHTCARTQRATAS